MAIRECQDVRVLAADSGIFDELVRVIDPWRLGSHIAVSVVEMEHDAVAVMIRDNTYPRFASLPDGTRDVGSLHLRTLETALAIQDRVERRLVLDGWPLVHSEPGHWQWNQAFDSLASPRARMLLGEHVRGVVTPDLCGRLRDHFGRLDSSELMMVLGLGEDTQPNADATVLRAWVWEHLPLCDQMQKVADVAWAVLWETMALRRLVAGQPPLLAH